MVHRGWLLILTVLSWTIISGSEALNCETSWVAYKDEKCFKLVDEFLTASDAESLCMDQIHGTGQPSADEDDIPPLLTIGSQNEQNFIINFIYNESSILDNIWLGAKRLANDSMDFLWSDGSVLEFSNWNPGYPSQTEGNDCTQMVPKGVSNRIKIGGKNEADGGWTDISCSRRNLVVCQKLQSWSLKKLQRVSLQTSKILVETSALLDEARAELNATKEELAQTKAELTNLENNPVPIGFIFVQFPNEADPSIIWPSVTWTDVTSGYAGLFFRAEGGGSASFGVTQSEFAPRISGVSFAFSYSDIPAYVSMPSSGTSGHIMTGWSRSGDDTKEGLHFDVQGGEIRPRNTAIRIWKRTA